MENLEEFLRSLGVEFQAGGRRRWSKAAKAYIVAETLKPGATVKAVARTFGVHANRLSEWRRLALDGKLVLPAPEDDEAVAFAPLVLCDDLPPAVPAVPSPPPEKVEIVFRGVSIRLDSQTAAPRIAEIARAVGVVE